MSKHAYLSASASARWIACTKSAKECANAADTPSEYAKLGSEAHTLCEHLVLKALGRDAADPTGSLEHYDAEMQYHAEDYCGFVMAEIAKAKKSEGEYAAGEHCRFCAVKAFCKARAEQNMELAKYEFVDPAHLSDDDVAEILPRLDHLVSWADDVKDYALKQALAGTRYSGFKLAEGRSARKYTDETAAAKAVEAAGYEPYEKKLKGITAMTSELGKKRFNEILGGLVYKPPGKPILIPADDKRPEINIHTNDLISDQEEKT